VSAICPTVFLGLKGFEIPILQGLGALGELDTLRSPPPLIEKFLTPD